VVGHAQAGRVDAHLADGVGSRRRQTAPRAAAASPSRARSAAKSTASALKAWRASCSSLSRKQGSSKPMRAASSRKICVLGFAWPSGATAGSLIST
jgi:hypothetical protein